jgi:hypothetical protein
MANQIKKAIDTTIKEFLDDLKRGMTSSQIQEKWEKRLNKE